MKPSVILAANPQRSTGSSRPASTLGMASVLAVAAFTLACVTINVYFPEAAVKDLSEKIEEAVAREAAKTSDAGAGGGEQSGSFVAADSTAVRPMAEVRRSLPRDVLTAAVGAVLRLTASPVSAQDQGSVAAPEISNPAIRKIIESRGARVGDLDRHKASGALGENNRALLDVRDLSALALQERAAVQRLVREENADRERMFKEIAAATGAALDQLPQIRRTYAETLRRNAKAGEWIQLPDGAWKQK
ncbi:MAG: DUF1318 domain-containing protein [Acidobacteriota bacterium]